MAKDYQGTSIGFIVDPPEGVMGRLSDGFSKATSFVGSPSFLSTSSDATVSPHGRPSAGSRGSGLWAALLLATAAAGVHYAEVPGAIAGDFERGRSSALSGFASCAAGKPAPDQCSIATQVGEYAGSKQIQFQRGKTDGLNPTAERLGLLKKPQQ